ncbi:serpin family protein [Prevotella sp.]|uniref:serpin family protein n=1 Tax=uncultured Prevotella sp. TaxID=159272 RepID=UPI0025D28777|nr:serpin family protein [uncultured Prevotella sp.]
MKNLMVWGLLAMMLASCGTTQNKQNINTDINAKIEATKPLDNMDNEYLILSDAQQSIVDRGNQFALNLFRTQAGMDSKVVSPLSVSFLMAMLANGADSTTKDEILSTVAGDKSLSVAELNDTYAAFLRMAANGDKLTTINIANYIALNKGFKLKSTYAGTVGSKYAANVENLDFASPKALKHINQWCSDKTCRMIPSIIDRLNPSDVAVLLNAIYFNGSWTHQFPKKNTRLENFQGYTRDIKKVDMMHQERKFFYADNSRFAAVELPYGNGQYSMTVLLPNEGVSINDMMKQLTAGEFAKLQQQMSECIVDLKLPRFSTTTNVSLNAPLSALGAKTMFTSSADFSGMADAGVFVSAMLQKAKIEVSEEGTKAAAVTAGVIALTALHEQPRHVKFHAKRPFVYTINEKNSNAILFIGQFTGEEE